MKRILLAAAVVSGLVLVSACAGTSTPTSGGGVPNFSLLQAGADGAIALDASTGALLGFDRTGVRAWADETALDLGADVRCLAACPDAVLSGTPGAGARFFALAHGGVLELVDASGKTVATREGVDAGLFTASGELVTVSPSGQVRWSDPG